ncbi:MAG: type I DNA topoisomerase, partial [Clostridia bacterium]|nr:type I DNA topoisomerase [Clostridia bacterium]
YGDNYLPEKPRYYKSKSGAQDAHEAIRPTNVNLTPADVKEFLTADQYKLYSLIWKRFIASLMAGCVQDTVVADVAAAGYILRTSGYTVRFDGFTALYEEGRDEDEEGNSVLPEMKQGDALKLKGLRPEQKFTQPPSRYTEPTLIKELDENGVGRPSTYVPIITNILQREYIEREKKSLKPTSLGEIITDIMAENFKDIVDIKFTAGMEDNLDKIESGELNWVKTIDEFYQGFADTLKAAESSMDGVRVKVPDVETDVVCDLCGRKMVVKNGRFGKFLACPGYPQCKNTKPIVNETAAECPVCGGKVLQKKSRNGKKYFGCEHNPKCSFMTWDDPTSEKCPNCGKSLFKRRGGVLLCLAEGCGYEAAAKSRKKAAKGENK